MQQKGPSVPSAGRIQESFCYVKKNKVSLTKRQVHIAIHFENCKIIKRKLHREVLKSWVPFLTNIYHISKFTFSARQPGFGCSNGLKLDPCLMAEATD